jgi:carboxymethylenebutenolidase
MCYGPDSRPPIAPIAGAAVDGQRLELTSADGTRFLAYAASAVQPTGSTVLILPDVRGLHSFYEELALRFAEAGLDALAVDYFGRTAGTRERSPDFDHQAHVEQASYPALLGDLSAAVAHLRAAMRPRSVFTVGFCFGGRLAFLSATRAELGLAGAVGFYGVPVGRGRAGMPAPADLAAEVRCPILGLFGGDDPAIPAESVEAYRTALTEGSVDHELVSYPGAPHSFFDRREEQFFAESGDAWRRVLEFVQKRAAASSP